MSTVILMIFPFYNSGSWCTPFFTGQRPPPCADFTLTSINNFRAILYGGDRGIYVDSQDLYLLDLKNLVSHGQ